MRIPCVYKDSLYADSQMDIPGSFRAVPGAASIISNSFRFEHFKILR